MVNRTSKPWIKTTINLVILAAILWVAHYFHFRSLGLYEDDYAYISQPLGWHLADLLQYLRVILTWPQGRPLGFFLPHFLAFLGGKLGGLSTVYIFAFLVQATNACLFYFLLKRVGSEALALIGALTFGLFPADTTHTFLMHSLGLHTSLTFLLIASLLYTSGRKIPSYLFALASLVTYESPYVVFLAIPLLGRTWDRKLARDMVRHTAIWLGIFILVLVIRAGMGEGRVVAAGSSIANLGLIMLHTLEALVIGPAVSLWMFGYGPGRTLFHWNWELTFVFAGCLLPFAWMLSRTNSDSPPTNAEASRRFRWKVFSRKRSIRFSIPYPETVKLLLVSLIMLSLAYGFSFTHFPPTALYGRMTSVHLAAALGGSLFFACLCSLGLSFARSHRLRYAAVSLLVIYFSLLVAYRFSIQLDFKQAWQNERTFWSNAIAEVPDLTDGTIVFVLDHDLPTTRYILTNSWADPIMLAQTFQFPADWKTPPRLFVVHSDWTKTIHREGDQLQWEIPAATWKPHLEVLPDSNVIVLEMENGKLVRRFGSIVIKGQELRLKPMPDAPGPGWKKGTLYPYLIGNPK